MASFEDLPVSTQTFIVKSNITLIRLNDLYDSLSIKEPEIIMIKYRNNCKGHCMLPIKNSIKNFLNCVSISIVTDKKINVKIFNNGVFQMTGCKSINHVIFCMNILVRELLLVSNCYDKDDHLCDSSSFIYYIVSAMRNIDFEIGFKIDRQALGTHLSSNTKYSVPPMSSGYMGVKLKIPIDDSSIYSIKIRKIIHSLSSYDESFVSYEDFYTNIYPNPKKLKKKYFVSVSIFQNGKVLMSGADESLQKPYYEWLKQFTYNSRNIIGLNKSTQKEQYVKVIKTFKRELLPPGYIDQLKLKKALT